MTSLVRAEQLSRGFRMRGRSVFARRRVMAVREVEFEIGAGEAVGLVGESGCGKSTVGRLLLRLIKPSSGRVLFEGKDLARLSSGRLRGTRARMQMIFQNPNASLDPRRSVGGQIADGILAHGLGSRAAARGQVADLLTQVGLAPMDADRLPHEFSGGQRQRIAIARALATSPAFIVADEPISSLDISIQAQIVNLFADLRADLGLAMLFISHDLHIVRHLCTRVMVMYLGRIVEIGPASDIFRTPAHPYTRALLSAAPSLARRREPVAPVLRGELPDPASPPSGCAFRTRCPLVVPRCAEALPPLRSVAGIASQVACWRVTPH